MNHFSEIFASRATIPRFLAAGWKEEIYVERDILQQDSTLQGLIQGLCRLRNKMAASADRGCDQNLKCAAVLVPC